ncbi:Murein DD-endopeptidase MepM and murein hydrolase activator NlpD, contain LysM domain [Arthrobacter crystallopoietes]|uniref:Peptidase n=3 Tax=Micrococcaceae TaxID=1268 RepID=Q6SK87_PAEAU|nr:peptidase [Paenarthrobacter aurescens]ABM10476.1 M23 peptidase domain protein [Paenarthrobacter aurescens TC1]SDQ03251.1 Murein DD-endopeptidase MepM and murein hydrolase activator NlpD, contain LysM domain [Arthrobacter crystallopoietes]
MTMHAPRRGRRRATPLATVPRRDRPQTGRRRAAHPSGSPHKVKQTAVLATVAIGMLTAAALPLPQTDPPGAATAEGGPGSATGRVWASAEAELDFGRSGLSSKAAPREPAEDFSAASPGVPPEAAAAGEEKPEPQQQAPGAAGQASGLNAPLAQMTVSSPFGFRTNPMTGAGGDFHNGTDLSSGCETPVMAAGSGVVSEASSSASGYGNRIVIDHGGGLKTTYNHLGSMAMQTGQAVAAGERIAGVGTTGNSTGCHLHFEVLVDGETVDSSSWL